MALKGCCVSLRLKIAEILFKKTQQRLFDECFGRFFLRARIRGFSFELFDL